MKHILEINYSHNLKKMINRHTIFQWFKNDFPGEKISIMQRAFKNMSDEELAKYFVLKQLRRGYFYR